jgi:hypothetical protein
LVGKRQWKRRPDPLDYRVAPRALELIADAVRRGGDQDRPWLVAIAHRNGEWLFKT